jgi:hypothetical protein
VSRLGLVQHRDRRLEAPAQVDAVVGVADGGVEVGQWSALSTTCRAASEIQAGTS